MNPFEREVDNLLGEPVPAALHVDHVAQRASAIRRRRRVTAAAATAVVVMLFGSFAVTRQPGDRADVRTVDDPATSAPSKPGHVQRFRFVEDGDDTARQETARRLAERYRVLGYDATIVELGPSGFALVDGAGDDETDQLAAALSATGAVEILPVLANSAGAASCAPGELPQWQPSTATLIACFDVFRSPERSYRPPSVDPGADPLVVEANVAGVADGIAQLDVTLAAAVAAGVVPVAAGCQNRSTCPAGFMVLGFDGTVLARVEMDGAAGDRAALTGLFSAAQARLLGAVLRTGRLPLAIERVTDAPEEAPPASDEPAPNPTAPVFPRSPVTRSSAPVSRPPASVAPPTPETTTTGPELPASTTTTAGASTTTTSPASTTTTAPTGSTTTTSPAGGSG